MGCIYKLLAKTLAIWLKTFLPSIIFKSQKVFLPGRQIIDCSMLANECIYVMQKEDWPGIVCKVDMEKAYDHVNWGYLDWVLGQMGFGVKWINWIKICVLSVLLGLGEWVPKWLF